MDFVTRSHAPGAGIFDSYITRPLPLISHPGSLITMCVYLPFGNMEKIVLFFSVCALRENIIICYFLTDFSVWKRRRRFSIRLFFLFGVSEVSSGWTDFDDSFFYLKDHASCVVPFFCPQFGQVSKFTLCICNFAF